MHANVAFAYVVAPLSLLAAIPSSAVSAATQAESRALGLERAVGEFGLICLRTYPDKGRMEYLLKRSDLAFQPTSTGGEWRSKSVTISDLEPRDGAPHCAFEALVSTQDVASIDVAAAIEARIKAELGMVPQRQIHNGGLVWKWYSDGKAHTVTQFYAEPIRKQQLVLSYRIAPKQSMASR
jgi:hypothetical protein